MINETKAAELEAAIRKRTRPINGQYPRPCITSSKDPASPEVFVVGMNDARIFLVIEVGSHDRFLDALFNRGGEDCYKLFYEMTSVDMKLGIISTNIICSLEKHQVTDVLSTNAICYSAPMSFHPEDNSHAAAPLEDARFSKRCLGSSNRRS
jgi:hypothetical protein